MQTTTKLTVAFAAQAALAGVLFMTTQASQQAPTAAPLLGFPTEEISKIVISDGSKTTTAVKSGEHWQLADLSELPANTTKLSSLLSTLNGLRTRWPVVSSANGRERFEVTEEKFQRHLQLYAGDELRGDYYFGTSPSFKQTHVRRAADDEVYALAFNNFDLPTDGNDWLDKGLLKAAKLTSIQGGDFALTKSGEQWQLTGNATLPSPELDATKVDGLVNGLQNLQVLRLADNVPSGETKTLTASDGTTTWTFEFTKADTQYFVRRSDRPQAFTVSSLDYDRTAGISLTDLLKPVTTPAPTGDGDSPAQVSAAPADKSAP